MRRKLAPQHCRCIGMHSMIRPACCTRSGNAPTLPACSNIKAGSLRLSLQLQHDLRTKGIRADKPLCWIDEEIDGR